MSSTNVGTAFVQILPDTTQFRALLQAQVNAAVAQVRVPGVATAGGSVNSSAAAAATQTANLAAASTVAAGSSARQASASLALTKALETQRLAELALTKATLEQASAEKIQTLQTRSAIATSAVEVARLRQAESLKQTATGLASVSTQNKVLQGSLIGLSRITPVAVFGLGVYGSAAIAAGLAIKSSINAAADFGQQLNTFQATTGVSGKTLEEVRRQALALGADTKLAGISASDAALGLTELAKAGIEVNDALAASRGVLQLAGAASISAGDAAGIVATQLNAFKLDGSEAVRVADLLASASIAAQGEIVDFAAAFQQVSATAKQSGLSVEQTTAALTELARAGILGADAGTSLRTFLLRLVPTTKEASQFTKALGIELDQTKTVGEQLPEVIEQYRNALSVLNTQQQTLVLNQIFGQDAFRASAVIFSQNRGELDQLVESLGRAGVAQELSDAKAKGLKGAFSGLGNELENVGIKLGSLVDGPLEKFVRGVTDSIKAIENLVDETGNLVSALGNVTIPVIGVPFEVIVTGGGRLGDIVRKAVGIGVGAVTPKPILLAKTVLDQFKTQETFGSVELNLGETDDTFGIGGFIKGVEAAREREFERTFGAAARRNKDFAKSIRERLNKLIADGLPNPDDLSPGEVVVQTAQSGRFQNPVLEAQLQGDLQAELQARKAVEAFLQERLNLAKDGSAAYKIILEALVNAHKETLSVQGEINQNQKDFNAQQEKNSQDAADEARRSAAAQEQLRQTIIDIQTQRLSNRELIANRTEGTDDNKRIFEDQIKFLQVQKKYAETIARDASLGRQAQVDAQKKIESLNAQIIQTRDKIRNLGKDGSSDGGFTLQEFFQEAVNQFNTFGSNIVKQGGILSGQDARGSLGRDAALSIQGAQLTQQEKQTALLTQLVVNTSGERIRVDAAGVGKRGSLLGINEALSAQEHGYG